MEDLRGWESQFKTMTTKAGKTYDMPTQKRFKLLRSQLGIVNKSIGIKSKFLSLGTQSLLFLKPIMTEKHMTI